MPKKRVPNRPGRSRERPSLGARPRLVICAPFSSRAITFAGRQQATYGFRLIPLAITGAGGAALPGLAQVDAGKADRAAGGGGPLDIARGQIPFRSGFRPPNANEQEAHRVCNRLP